MINIIRKRHKCNICTDIQRNIVVLDCKHQICYECIIKLIKYRLRKCPYCRNKIKDTISSIKLKN